jgi:FlaA1/EpsC-like NDP-sugar epimerase
MYPNPLPLIVTSLGLDGFFTLIVWVFLMIYLINTDGEEMKMSKFFIISGVIGAYTFVASITLVGRSVGVDVVISAMLLIGYSVVSFKFLINIFREDGEQNNNSDESIFIGGSGLVANYDNDQFESDSTGSTEQTVVDDEEGQEHNLPPTGHIVESDPVDEGPGPTVTDVPEEIEE